jgi:hypothetical protein
MAISYEFQTRDPFELDAQLFYSDFFWNLLPQIFPNEIAIKIKSSQGLN